MAKSRKRKKSGAGAPQRRRPAALRPPSERETALLGAAVSLQRSGQWQRAEAACEELLSLNPRHFDACHLRGVLALQQGQASVAALWFKQALVQKGDVAAVHTNLGRALEQLGQQEAAANAYEIAIELNPADWIAASRLGTVCERQGDFARAERVYETALQHTPDQPEILGKLAFLYETQNRLDAAATVAQRGLELAADDPIANLVLAKCERRQGEQASALARLERTLSRDPRAVTIKELHYELGGLYDLSRRCDEAFDRFQTANRLAARQFGGRIGSQTQHFRQASVLQQVFTADWVSGWQPAPPSDFPPPAFLIGFPRSGTTLLEHILAAHPQIRTLEERPTISTLKLQLANMPGGYPQALATLSDAQILQLRATYAELAGLPSAADSGKTIVDKYPLNLLNVGIILRIFPNARFIFVLRHPCDACLSCFMQHFGMNDAMANFLTLEDTVAFYVQAMRLWEVYERVFAPRVVTVRYEDVLEDMPEELRCLLSFLELPWADKVLEYAALARERDKINTPSYHQVVEPVHQAARGRWQRYQTQFSTLLPQLQPFLERFGYAD